MSTKKDRAFRAAHLILPIKVEVAGRVQIVDAKVHKDKRSNKRVVKRLKNHPVEE